MSRDVRNAMIEPDHPELSLSRQCRMVRVSRPLLYYRPRPASEETLARTRRIDEIYLACPLCGSRQIMRLLHCDGHQVVRHQVCRLMRLMGLQAIYQAPKTSEPHPEHRCLCRPVRGGSPLAYVPRKPASPRHVWGRVCRLRRSCRAARRPPGCPWQRCQFHLAQNAVHHSPNARSASVLAPSCAPSGTPISSRIPTFLH